MMMNYLSRISVMLLASILLTACAKDGPETTAEDFYWTVAAGDADKALGMISLAEVSDDERIQAEGKFQTLIGEMHSQITAKEGLSSVEVLETSPNEDDEDKAQVRVQVTFGNGEEQEDTLNLVRVDGDWKITLN